MEEVLRRTTRLLQNGKPEEALHLINGLDASTSEVEKIKTACNKALSEQYLWLLNDAAINNRINEIQKYVKKYHYYIGYDKRIEKYEGIITNNEKRQQQEEEIKKSTYHIRFFALASVLFLILELLSHTIFYKFCSWPVYGCISALFHCVYVICTLKILLMINQEKMWNLNQLRFDRFDSMYILFLWAVCSLLISLINAIRTLSYNNPFEGTHIGLIISSCMLIVYIISKLSKNAQYKRALLLACIAMILEIVKETLIAYIYHHPLICNSRGEEISDTLYSWIDCLSYGSIFLMTLFFFIVIKKTSSTEFNQYGTN